MNCVRIYSAPCRCALDGRLSRTEPAIALELKAVQVRLNEDAMEALRMLADIEDKDLGEKARELLTRVLLGEVHAAKLQAARFARATKSGKER